MKDVNERYIPGFPTGAENIGGLHPPVGWALQNLIGGGLSQYMGEAWGA